ncbi:hypothetical protein BKA70DRAFT_1531541 [Coprinopsis sp. MPI-PUGE-AT-0042]|nr:hypothetical protein BKA70DRAFT_1531541 [Coprinopsis sp. MPI-PUGE-AT-0042]
MAELAATVHVERGAAAPLTQSDAVASLLSLSFSEGGTTPATAPSVVHAKLEPVQHSIPTPSTSVSSPSSMPKHHRRLSSTGKTKRRLSDAREAANRPSPSLLQSNTAGLSLASLSLSSSPPGSYPAQLSTSFGAASRRLAPTPLNGSSPAAISTVNGRSVHAGSVDDTNSTSPLNGEEEANDAGAIPIPTGRSGRKRGADYKCETCSKIYKHPSCLIKHRWEHTPHWREASKFVLSKHQQVQLLEAAAILSHMSPTVSGGRSLPDDRSLWPSFLSGGSLPTPDSISAANSEHQAHAISPSNSYSSHPISSSVPARPMSTGPRMHAYGVGSNLVTQVRPGLTVGMVLSANLSPSQEDDEDQSSLVQERGAPVTSLAECLMGRTETTHGIPKATDMSGASLSPASSVRSGSSPPRSLSRSRSGSAEAGGAHRLSDDSPASDDGVLDNMDGVEDDRVNRSIRIVGDKYGSMPSHGASKSFDGYTGRHSGFGHGRLGSYGGRRFPKDDDYDDYAVREEDEDETMDAMDGMGRLRKPVKAPLAVKREEQWDGMEMDMDMD